MKVTIWLRIKAASLCCAAILLALGAQNAYAVTEDFKLNAIDKANDDEFGKSVAIDNETAIVGAWHADNGLLADSGNAWVYRRTVDGWALQAKLTPSDAALSDYFGCSVSISGDTAIVGAYGDDDGGSASGCAYVFTRSGGKWTEQAKLVANDPAANDFFGWSVSVSGDTALVGALQDDDGGLDSGSAYVFTRSGTVWTQQQNIAPLDTQAEDGFGNSVSLFGETALIGAFVDDGIGVNSGSAYVFTRSGTLWSEQAKLIASDTALADWFGYSVSLFGDTALIGAIEDDDAGSASGSAYVFTRSGTVWSEQQKLTASDAAAGDQFGWSVSVSGETAIIGALANDGIVPSSGSAYVFNRSGTVWSEQSKLNSSDADSGDLFGNSVTVSGGTAVVGAFQNYEGGINSGSAYTFDLVPQVTLEDPSVHDADQNANYVIGLSELLRVIQLFNLLAYHYCPESATEDGFCPGP